MNDTDKDVTKIYIYTCMLKYNILTFKRTFLQKECNYI